MAHPGVRGAPPGPRRRSSVVEQRFRKPLAGSSNLPVGSRFEFRLGVNSPAAPDGRLEREVVAKLAAALGQSEAGHIEPKRSRLTVAKWLATWLEDCEGRVRPTTYRRYADLLPA